MQTHMVNNMVNICWTKWVKLKHIVRWREVGGYARGDGLRNVWALACAPSLDDFGNVNGTNAGPLRHVGMTLHAHLLLRIPLDEWLQKAIPFVNGSCNESRKNDWHVPTYIVNRPVMVDGKAIGTFPRTL
jgi:hypothetical protein